MQEDKRWTIKQAAKEWGLKRTSVRDLINRGRVAGAEMRLISRSWTWTFPPQDKPIKLKPGAKPGKKKDRLLLPEQIRAARIAHGLTQRELGQACGYDKTKAQKRVSSWETDYVSVPHDKAKILVNLLGLDYLKSEQE